MIVSRYMRGLLCVLLTAFGAGVCAQSSVLSEGEWHKVGITESGMYKLDRSALEAMGIRSIGDPRKIQLFGNGVKGVLPQRNSVSRPVDLIENPIHIEGESDGVFDSQDYILFYGVGPHESSWTNEGFYYRKNIYSDTSYYFIKINGDTGKRVDTKNNLDGEPDLVIDSFMDHVVHEADDRNLISSGRNWLGEIISSGQQEQASIFIEGVSSPIQSYFLFAGQSSEQAEMEILVDNEIMGKVAIDPISTGSGAIYSLKAEEVSGIFELPQSSDFTLSLRYSSGGTNARSFLDRYYLTFSRDLKLYGNETQFRQINTQGIVEYRISGAANAIVWNVTQPANYYQQTFEPVAGDAIFKSSSELVEEFVVFRGSDFPSPFFFGSVTNQNLRGSINYDGIIITPPEFRAEAERLANFHREEDNLSVIVVTPRQIYNEFSAGRQDVSAIRDYARYVYEEGGQLKYLLLFGDCSYDYKTRLSTNTNFVPTYQSRNSYHPIYSYSSDDYFAFLEEEEGEWEEVFSGDHTMEIGVGRLPVKSPEEAHDVVDKIIYYSTSPNTLGKWKNEITYLADDGDGNTHSAQVEELSKMIDTTYTQYAIKKLLLDAFDQISDGAKDSSPQATNALKTDIKKGTFVINFIGHGNERLWTSEEVLTIPHIQELTNKNKLPIFVTATCEFGRYDDPFRVSGAEQLILSGKGGAIALLTTSRPVFASTNFELNQAFHDHIFSAKDGDKQRLGDIIRQTKNEGLAGPVNRNFTLLGDPMLKPAYPKLDLVVNELENSLDTLSALEKMTFSGEVQNGGLLQENFNGSIFINVLDIEQQFQTQGQESLPFTYTLRSNSLFRGESEVVDGRFEFEFIVPKNISYNYGRGKLTLYAMDSEANIDASGSSREFVIGGTATDFESDITPPVVSMFMNDMSFSNGGSVGKNSLLIADISDDSGITTARSGVVEGITLEVNDEIYNLNEFYTAAPNSYKEGTIVFPIQDLVSGRYTALLRVWDTHNNVTTTSLDFVVSNENRLFTFNESSYPNPIRNGDAVTFHFEHDREEEDLSVALLIYNGRGEVVNKSEYLFENTDRTIDVRWQGTTDSGFQLNEGIYYYRLIIQSNFDGATKEIAQKLVVIN